MMALRVDVGDINQIQRLVIIFQAEGVLLLMLDREDRAICYALEEIIVRSLHFSLSDAAIVLRISSLSLYSNIMRILPSQ